MVRGATDKMDVLPVLLMFFTVSGYSYTLQPRLAVVQVAGMDRDHLSEMRSEQLRDEVYKSVEEMSEGVSPEANTVEERRGEDVLTSETNPEKKQKIPETQREGYSVVGTVGDLDTGVVGERRDDGLNLGPKTNDESRIGKTMLTDTIQEEGKYETDVKFKKTEPMEQLKQTILENGRVSELAPDSLHKVTTGDDHEDDKTPSVKQKIVEEKGERGRRVDKRVDLRSVNHKEIVDREKEEHTGFRILTAPLSTSLADVGKEAGMFGQIPSNSPSYYVHPPLQVAPTYVPLVPTPHAKVGPQFFPPPVSVPNPTTSVVLTELRSVSLLEDLLVEVAQRNHLKQMEPDVKVKPHLGDVMVKNSLSKPPQKELQTTHTAQKINTVVQLNKSEITSRVQGTTPKPKDSKFLAKYLNTKEPNPTFKSNGNKFSGQLVKPNMTCPTGKPKTVKLTKPLANLQLTSAVTALFQPTQSKRSKNKIVRSEENRRKKDNKTQKPSKKKKVNTPTYFPYFMDNYCPPECVCYGRVVQCSDKRLDKVPYGIPYNARYILLMNNDISSIQLDLLREYLSMEFLVLSNNQLTDGAIEGAFEGVLALKRLYLDRNLLESVPTDLPDSLEDLRLDNNRLSVISEAAWPRCPNLLVLSLRDNSLGNGSESLPNAVLSPLSKLRTLNLDHNQLTSVPLGLPLSIKELYLKGNLIERFSGGVFNGISELVVLDLSANRLTDKGLLRVSLLNATHLESLNFEGNRLKKVPRHLPHSLKMFNLEGNLITSITKAAFSTLKNLEHLGLARNKIFRVAPGAFRTLLVLHQLDLSDNTLQQVPRQLPQGLHSVVLTHNKIQSVPGDAFCWGNKSSSLSGLVRVQLEHNLIDMGKLNVHAFRCLRGFQVVHFY